MRYVAIYLSVGIVSISAAAQFLLPGPPSVPALSEPPVVRQRDGVLPTTAHLPFLLGNGQRPTEIQEFVFDSLINAFSYYSWQQQPLWWDPASNVLVTVKRGGSTQQTGDGNRLYYRYSTTRGQSWSQPVQIFDGNPVTQLPRYPSGYLVNPGNSQNPEDLILVFTSPVTSGQGWIGSRDGFVQVGSADVESWFSDGATVTIPGSGSVQYTWSTDSRITATAAGDIAFVLSSLIAPNTVPTSEQNYIGLRLHDFSAPPVGYVPDEWRSTVFADPGQPGFRTNTPIGIARDDAGNIVAAVFGRFANADDPGLPTVGFFISRDGGNTWQGPTFLQPSAIRSYAFDQGATVDNISVPFGLQTVAGGAVAVPKSFAAYGNGAVSIAFQIFDFDTTKPLQDRIAQMVEATYANGTWTLRKIADRSWLTFALIPDPNSPAATQVGNELQLCRTADGTKLLAKWIEGTVYIAQVDINNDGVAPDTFLTTDVYVATRTLPDGAWSEPVNVTQTPIWDKLAWIPPIVPNDLQQIPLVMVKTIVDTNVVPTILQRLVDAQWQLLDRQYVTIATFSAVTSVEEPRASGGEQLQVRVTPQPVRQELRLLVGGAAGGRAIVELYTVAGERVAVRELELTPGQQLVVLPLDGVASGTYMLQVRHGASVATVPVVVVR
ncbi:hypothetical protein HRbin21_01075 [bacterium HR21]|nr:hypothetical protein HRbin21_01075 [bacterium HR21]